ncbi:hypothetical protein H8J86_07910 [Clostridium perfringens]|uniref:hypothetical protein n=1 Tax=Clostridium perfringens TaxID=1502 RepID=UPI0018E4D654|nr:hypothetical protein [Clostridium perfringens]MBI6005876.1 hypothetical protein [Clostridium perfringens]
MLDQYIRKVKKIREIKDSLDLDEYLYFILGGETDIREKELFYTYNNWDLENYFRYKSKYKKEYDQVLIIKEDVDKLKELGIDIDFNNEEIFYYVSF